MSSFTIGFRLTLSADARVSPLPAALRSVRKVSAHFGALRKSFFQPTPIQVERSSWGVSASSAGSGDLLGPFSKSKLRKMRKVEVERLLEDRSLDTSGNKEALMERLLAAQGEADPEAEDVTATGPEIVSVSRQARGTVVGERKPAPLVEVPPADIEGLQQDIDRLDAATADLALRAEAANAAREKERLLLEEVTAEIKAAEEQMAAEDALKLALPIEPASDVQAKQEVREKAVGMLQGVLDRHPAPAVESSPDVRGATVQERHLTAPAAAQAARDLFAGGRPEFPALEKPTAPATLALMVTSVVGDLLSIFKRHTNKDKHFLVDAAAAFFATLVVLKLGH